MIYKVVVTQPVISTIGKNPYTFKIDAPYVIYTSNQVKKQSGTLSHIFTKPVPMEDIRADFITKIKDAIKDVQALDEQKEDEQFIKMVKRVEAKANEFANPEVTLKGGLHG